MEQKHVITITQKQSGFSAILGLCFLVADSSSLAIRFDFIPSTVINNTFVFVLLIRLLNI